MTAFNGQGEMLRILLKQPESDADRDNTVRVVVGAAAATELVEQFEQRYDLAVLDAYGMTETGPTIAASGNTAARAPPGGRPRDDAKVVDEDDVEVAAGVTGEIVVRPKLGPPAPNWEPHSPRTRSTRYSRPIGRRGAGSWPPPRAVDLVARALRGEVFTPQLQDAPASPDELSARRNASGDAESPAERPTARRRRARHRLPSAPRAPARRHAARTGPATSTRRPGPTTADSTRRFGVRGSWHYAARG